jgi:penicillin-binding protein 1C
LHTLIKYRKSYVLGAVFFLIICASKYRYEYFDDPFSVVLLGDNGELLGATTASDGQWRFAGAAPLPVHFTSSLLTFEDRNFYGHKGVYLPSIFRAAIQNSQHKKIIRGGSTISMQLARIIRKNPSRTWPEKFIEAILAWQIEQAHSKSEILSLYAHHAPYGGNVVGIEAAAWRYYGRPPDQLSWSAHATLAALPNAPSLIYPGKLQDRLRIKRDKILAHLHQSQQLSEQELEVAILEELPQRPHPLPQCAPHLLQYLKSTEPTSNRFASTIVPDLQKNGARILEQHMANHEPNLIYNCAALIVDVRTGEVKMYHGNNPQLGASHQGMVDIVHAPRSTGSILKPTLYAAMLQDGLLLPETLIDDIPLQISGFTPKNYYETYDGLVPASNALSRSLNIPSVVMLQQYGYPRYVDLLKRLGLQTIQKPADHYGLSIILGGAESTLWDLTKMYAGMGRTLQYAADTPREEPTDNYQRQSVLLATYSDKTTKFGPLNAASIWCTYQALMKVNRPDSELGWQMYDSAIPIAWKTGTSFGNRDAWAIGSTADYVIGVWVGNADGTGRPLLTGIQSAAPILFDLFKMVDQQSTFAWPKDGLQLLETCSQSGMRKGPHCPESQWQWCTEEGVRTEQCAYHQVLFLDPQTQFQVTSTCFPVQQMITTSYFRIPAVQAYYYKNKHPEYLPEPAFHPDCGDNQTQIGIIYPRPNATLYLPRGLDGKDIPLVMQATHQRTGQKIYWHLDDHYLATTQTIHQIEVLPSNGWHTLSVVDEQGLTSFVRFEVASQNNVH